MRSKLDLLCELHRQSWVAGNPPLAPLEKGIGAKVYSRDAVHKSKWYMLALLFKDIVFMKGVQRIHHDRTQGYYQALLLAKIDKLRDIDKFMPDKDYKKLLDQAGAQAVRDAAPEAEADAVAGEPRMMLEDRQVELDEEHDSEGEAEVLQLLERSGVGRGRDRDVETGSIVRTADIAGVARLFVKQTWSHTSGKLRFYIACPNTMHSKCFRYTLRERFPSDDECAAHLISWAVSGLGIPEKASHLLFQPCQTEVAATQAAFPRP